MRDLDAKQIVEDLSRAKTAVDQVRESFESFGATQSRVSRYLKTQIRPLPSTLELSSATTGLTITPSTSFKDVSMGDIEERLAEWQRLIEKEKASVRAFSRACRANQPKPLRIFSLYSCQEVLLNGAKVDPDA